jgi:dipeptidyl aminopeptidase/acylaminoacyl peptidase
MRARIVLALAPPLLWLAGSCGPASTPTPVGPEPAEPVGGEELSPAETGALADPGGDLDPGYTGLGADSVPPEVVARFAAPPLAPAMSSRIEAMLDVRGATGGLLTSRASRLVFTWNVTGVSQVWRLDGPMRYPVQLTGGEDATALVGLAPDDAFVVVSRDVGGQENPGLYLVPIEGGPLVEIHRKDRVQTLLAFVADDSRSVWYLANDREPSSYALYRWDVASRTARAVFTEPGIWRVHDHQGEAKILLARLRGNTHVEIHELDVASGALTPVIGQDDAELHVARYGARAGTVLVQTNKVGDFHRLYRLEQGKLTPISPEVAHDIATFSIDRARRRIYYVLNEGGYQRAHALDARTYKPLALPKLPAAEHLAIGATTRDGRYLEVRHESATRPPTSAVWDWNQKKLVTWRVPSTPELEPSTFTAARLETYPARDGTPIPMFVWRADPARCAGPCPVVVSFHGGPESQATPGFRPHAQLFVEAGFTYVTPNVRGSAGYGKTWLDADNGPRRLQIITDIEDCARHIRTEWAVGGTAPRIGVTGGSYGGYSTLMAMTYFAGAYDAGVAQVGMSNLVTFLENTAPYRRILRITEYGDPVQDRDALRELSPITHVDKLAGPLLLIQGVNDPRVPVGEALQIHRALERRGIPGGLILFPDEGHGTAKRGNRVLALGHTIAFFQEHLR